MHSLLSKLLVKRKIDSLDKLDEEEKQTFVDWERVLVKEELNIEDIKKFCRGQLQIIETKWADYEIPQSKKAEFLPYYTVYKTILSAIESPKAAKEALEEQLINLIK